MRLVQRFCEMLARHLKEPRRIDREDGDYLLRYFLFGGPRSVEPGHNVPPGPWWARRLPFAPYLHHFLRSDDPRILHNHPWNWSVSLILTGGYAETRARVDEHGHLRFVRRLVKPGRLNLIRHRDFHRVDLVGDTWTLFIAGRRVADWGFLDLFGRYTPHAEFQGGTVARANGAVEASP